MRGKSVYLAGPISGLNYVGATEWRLRAKALFKEFGGGDIDVFDPMRAKEYLAHVHDLGWDHGELNTMSTPRGITTRDRFDCMRADVLLMNLGDSKKVSIGTMIEAGWADAAKVPVCLLMEPGNCHDHGMLTEIAGWRPTSLEEAVMLCTRFLLP
jgi:nucleoside 2-deoxyribosyltransferase